MPGEVGTFVSREERQRSRDQCADLVKGARPRRAEEGFQFGERQLDGIEVGTVGRQESHLRAASFNRRSHLRLLVGGQVVEDDDIAGPQRRHEDLFDVREERRTIDGAIEDRGCAEAIEPQCRDHGVRLPVTAGRVIAHTRATRTAAIASDEIRGDATFIEKNVVSKIAERLPLPPAAPLSGDVGPPLFVGVNRFF